METKPKPEFRYWIVTAIRQFKSWNPSDNSVTFTEYARTREKAIKSARAKVWEYFSKEDGRISYTCKLRDTEGAE